jgi:hypothetical protein
VWIQRQLLKTSPAVFQLVTFAEARSTFTVVAARYNIVVKLTFFTLSTQLPIPDHTKLLDIETRALRAVKPA